ncbi:M56 family metallopeptidase [Paraglaciecola sp.]|uniref:M56 family metallopeptidase n=1 Tax=Paraglaciecola sp. TaxID=1920173 RepID=UPI003EF9B375
MITYFIISLLISMICVFSLLLSRNAPARKRFYICVILLTTWLTPWHLIQLETTPFNPIISENIFLDLKWVHTSVNAPLSTIEQVKYSSKKKSFTWSWGVLLLGAFGIGIVLFWRDISAYLKLSRQWFLQSKPDNHVWQEVGIADQNYQIRRLSGYGPGMTSGLFNKVIWLEASQQDTTKLKTIITHELTHIRQHDPYWLWAINLMQRLFWWNPIVTFTTKYAKQQIELSCDEKCQKDLPHGEYQQQLISLTLDANKQKVQFQSDDSCAIPAIIQMSGTQAFNLQRINKLNKIHTPKKRYTLVLLALLSIISWIGFSNATVNLTNPNEELSFVQILEKPIAAYKEDNIDLAFSLFQKPLASINSYTANEKAKIWMFYTKVLFKKDFTDPEILAYLDKAIALGDSLPATQLLSLLSMANSRALSQRKREKQISYLTAWFKLAGDEHRDFAQKSYMAAMAHYSLKQYPKTITLLNRVIEQDRQEGKAIKEMWLTLQVASYKKSGQLLEAYDVLQDLAKQYPSEKRQKQLKQLSNRLNKNT